MTLYGFPREPESSDAESVESQAPQPRVISEPVPVPGATGRPSPYPPNVAPGRSSPYPPEVAPETDALAPGAKPGAYWPELAEPPAAEPVAPPEAAGKPVPPDRVRVLADLDLDFALDSGELDEPVIVPWDRRPLMVVLAGGAALVLLAVLSGIASSAIFGPGRNPVSWQGPGAAPTTAPAVPPVPGDTITLSGVGDVIMGTQPGKLPPRNGEGFFDPVKNALAADLVMGNLETPLTVDTGRTKCGAPPVAGCYQFYLPPSYANHLRAAGFHVVNLANNHTYDMGPEGLANTRQALDADGIKHTGAPNQITYVDVKGVKVAVLGFAIYSWGQNLNDISAAEELVRKADAAADLVVIQMQGGAEGADKTHVRPGHEIFLGEDRGDLIKFSHAVIDAGADVVFGHGPHIMRGMEFYKGRLIAYSLGNFCGYGVLNSAGFLGVGGVLRVTLTKDGSWASGQLIATEMVRGGMPAPDAEKRALAFVNGLSSADFGASAARISPSDGAITPTKPPR